MREFRLAPPMQVFLNSLFGGFLAFRRVRFQVTGHELIPKAVVGNGLLSILLPKHFNKSFLTPYVQFFLLYLIYITAYSASVRFSRSFYNGVLATRHSLSEMGNEKSPSKGPIPPAACATLWILRHSSRFLPWMLSSYSSTSFHSNR